jgi:hypothetical protein
VSRDVTVGQVIELLSAYPVSADPYAPRSLWEEASCDNCGALAVVGTVRYPLTADPWSVCRSCVDFELPAEVAETLEEV